MSGSFSTRVATGVGAALEKRFSRRTLLGRTAVVGAAVAVGGLDFVLKPQNAYAAVCGPGATCASGWTAMCCTINNGVNQCPTGSFAGGWWKADSAGLCGGSARYYVDCQAECTRCGCSGSSFCTSGCWNCTRHCASGTCDERRVCWNVFRYGQCNQQIGCSGPVLCRMISCNPPWTFEACTTDAATDNNTTDHTAPCLSPWSAIQARYQQLGGPASALGVTVGAEYAVAGGTVQLLTNGRLYSSAAGVHSMLPPRTTVYDADGGSAKLGLPITDDTRSATGQCVFNDLSFQDALYTTPNGTFLVSGSIFSRWVASGRDAGPVGWPVAATTTVTGGLAQQFSTGVICNATGGAGYQVWGAVYEAYAEAGGPNGSYGLPTGDVVVDGLAQSCTFQNGTISLRLAPRTLNRS